MALNQVDLEHIRSIVKEEISDSFEEILDDKLSKFKSEIFDRIDPILKEVTTAREERPLIENRLDALEEIHQEGKHSITS